MTQPIPTTQQVSGRTLTTIVSTEPLYFVFDISEADFLTLQGHLGGNLDVENIRRVPVHLHLMDETGWPHEGRLDFIDNQIDRGSGTIRVRAAVEKPGRTIIPGLFGRIRMAVSAPYDAFLVPDSAIVTDQNRKLVMTVTPEGTVVPKPVVAGPMEDGLRVIRSGLDPGDRVVIVGLMRARPGAKVKAETGVIEAGTPARPPQ